MRCASLLLVALLVSACGGSGAPPYDKCREPPPDYPPSCTTTCGNGVIDDCTTATPSGETCEFFSHTPEVCDGADLHTSCIDLGYYGGSAACTGCKVDDSGCDACAVACESDTGGNVWKLVPSGNVLAVVREATSAGGWTLTVDDQNLNEQSTVAIDLPRAIAPVPDGWILVGDTTLQHAFAAGGVTSSVALDRPAGSVELTGVASGPGNRVLLLWREYFTSQTMRVWASLVESDGTPAVAPFLVFGPSRIGYPAVTTDGVAFLVGEALAPTGQVIRIASDGTMSSSVTGYALGGDLVLSWGGSVGWFIVPTDSAYRSYSAQKFDATGAMVGAPISITSTTRITGIQTYGTGLVAASADDALPSPWRFGVVTFDATGTQTGSTEVGVSGPEDSLAQPFGSRVVASWWGARHWHFAAVAP